MMFVFYLIIAAFAIYVLLPYFDKEYRGRRFVVESAEQEELTHRKDEILTSMNDLEYDFQMKKVTEPDYLQLKEKLTQDYIAIKKQLDQMNTQSGNHHAVSSDTKKRKPQRVGS